MNNEAYSFCVEATEVHLVAPSGRYDSPHCGSPQFVRYWWTAMSSSYLCHLADMERLDL